METSVRVHWRPSRSGVCAEFWSTVKSLRSRDRKPTSEYSELAEVLGLSPKELLTAKRSLTTSAILTACWCYRNLAKTGGESMAGIWQLCPLLSLARREKLPTDSDIVSKSAGIARFVPVFDSSRLDFVFDAKKETFDVVGAHPSAPEKTEPLHAILSLAIPHAECKKRARRETMRLCKGNDRAMRFVNSCFVCSAIGLYGTGTPLKKLTDLRRVVDFYDWFVRSGDLRRKCMKTMEKEVLACITREYILFIAGRNPTLPLEECFAGPMREEMLQEFKDRNAENCAKFRFHATRNGGWTKGLKLRIRKGSSQQMSLEFIHEMATSTLLYREIVNELFGPPLPSSQLEEARKMIDKTKIYEAVGTARNFSSELASMCGVSSDALRSIDSIASARTPNRETIANHLKQLDTRDLLILDAMVCKLTTNSRIRVYNMPPPTALFKKFLEQFFGGEHYEKLYYGTCCPYPAIFNMCGAGRNGSDYEYGTKNVYIGHGEGLYCQSYSENRKKSTERLEMDRSVMVHLRLDIEKEMRKIFFYLCDRRYTYQLYRYIVGGISNPPSWKLLGPAEAPARGTLRSDPSEVLLLEWRWTDEPNRKPSTERESLLKDYRIITRIPPLFHELFAKTNGEYSVKYREMVHCKDFNVKSKEYVTRMRELHEERKAGLVRMECGEGSLQAYQRRGATSAAHGGKNPRTMFPELVRLPVTHSRRRIVEYVQRILKNQKNTIKYIRKRKKQTIKLWGDENTCHERNMVGRIVALKVRKSQCGNLKKESHRTVYQLCDHCGWLTERSGTEAKYFLCERCKKN